VFVRRLLTGVTVFTLFSIHQSPQKGNPGNKRDVDHEMDTQVRRQTAVFCPADLSPLPLKFAAATPLLQMSALTKFSPVPPP